MKKTELFNMVLKNDLSAFTQQSFNTVSPGDTYIHNWHIDLIAEYLEACRQGEILRLIINMPPRFIKSISVSVAFPAFLIGHDPTSRIMAASYSSKLATKHSIDTRLIIQSGWYREIFPDVILATDQNEKTKFETTKKGHRIITSVCASAIGEGGDYIIMDDPHDPETAINDKEREKHLNWFDQSLYTRLNNPKTGVIIVVMQRLHQNDLTGHLLAEGGWEHLKIPMEGDKKIIYDFGKIKKTREVGELLHEERFGIKENEAAKKRLTTYGYSGQYQQEPAPKKGGLIETGCFEYYDVLPDISFLNQLILSWDTANKEKELNDPSVCGTWATYINHPNKHFLVSIDKKRVKFPQLQQMARQIPEKVMEQFGMMPNAVLIEDKASGTQLIQDLKEFTRLSIKPIMPVQDKVTRMSNESPAIESGRVYLPRKAHWLFDFLTECELFPMGTYDDQVDQMSQYLKWQRSAKEIYVG